MFEGAPSRTVGQREFARLMQVSLRAVQKAMEDQRITSWHEKDGQYFIDPERCREEWARNTAPRPEKKKSVGGQAKKNGSKKIQTGSHADADKKRPLSEGPDENSVVNDSAGKGSQGTTEYAEDPDLSATRRRQREQDPDYNNERALTQFYETEIKRIELEQLEGRLIPADQVREEAFRTYRGFRDAMLAIPDRLAGILTGQTSQHEVHALLTDEITRALNAFSDPQLDAPGPAALSPADAATAAPAA